MSGDGRRGCFGAAGPEPQSLQFPRVLRAPMEAQACPTGDKHGVSDLRTSAKIPVPNLGTETAEAPTTQIPRGTEPAAQAHISSHDCPSPRAPVEAQEKADT